MTHNLQEFFARPVADVPPHFFGTPQWAEWCAPYMEVAAKRNPEDPQRWAEHVVRRDADEADLRTLGYCRDCGGAVTLIQVGACVYGEPCGHYRAQGNLPRIRAWHDKNLATITPERRASLLKLIGRAPVSPESPTQ